MAGRLWAPWRMEYIRRPRCGECFLCHAAGAVEGMDREWLILRRQEAGLLIMNRFPYNNGHLMVAPRRHVAALEDLTPEENAALSALTLDGLRALRSVMAPQGFNVGMNLGAAAGAGLEGHLHQHLVPRWNGDTNFMPVIGGTKVIPQALDKLYDQLRETLA